MGGLGGWQSLVGATYVTLALTQVVQAGVAIPAPTAGVLGPAGMMAAGAAVAVYFLAKKLRGPRA